MNQKVQKTRLELFMLSVEQTRKRLEEEIQLTNSIVLNIDEAYDYTISQDIISSINFPSFDQSAMDGYAFRIADLQKHTQLEIIGEEQAGDTTEKATLKEGCAYRIFTGAKIPLGADTVVMQEKTLRTDNLLSILDADLKIGSNIRPLGSQTKIGATVVTKGTRITPGTASLLAGLGLNTISVYQKPTITILTTGKELVQPGQPIQSGQIYESNSFALIHALNAIGIKPKEIQWVDDTLKATSQSIEQALIDSDVIILTGGVSVGDYDFVLPALQQNGVTQLVHKVQQKPGKPFYAGKKDAKYIFGLPGNPASVLTCFYMYVLPSLKKMMGFSQSNLPMIYMPLQASFKKKSGLTHFLKAIVNEHSVELLDHQESYKMNSFAIANALVEIDSAITELAQGDLVKTHLLYV